MCKRYVAAFFALALIATATAMPVARAAGSDDLMTAVRDVSGQTGKFRSMMADLNATQFHVVSVQSVLSPGSEPAFKAAVRKNAGDIDSLRTTLQHTTITGADGVLVTLTKVLSKQNVAIDQIVGIYVGGDGAITLFYQ
jgi:hypothetical protein